MNGKLRLQIKTPQISYHIELKRNVTVLKGDSAVGKTMMVGLIEELKRVGVESGVKVYCRNEDGEKVKVEILNKESNWEDLFKKEQDTVFIADEYLRYVRGKDFADAFYNSGKYIVLITRAKTAFLEYAIDSTYTISDQIGKNGVVNMLDEVYKHKTRHISPNIVVTEDTRSGKKIIQNSVCVDVYGAGGKDKVVTELMDRQDKAPIYVIVDGAAYGKEISRTISYIRGQKAKGRQIELFTPESIEYMILNTGVFKNKCYEELNNIIEETYKYINYKKYKSWETYYTDELNNLIKKYFNFDRGWDKTENIPKVMRTSRFKKEILYQLEGLTDEFIDRSLEKINSESG